MMSCETDGHYRLMMSDRLMAIRGQFQEMPGLRLTLAQARRLFGLDEAASTAALAALVEAGYLTRTQAGAYVRCDVR